MSIRQQGGVFGRNPAFNDVEVQGQLDLDGKAVFNNQLEIYTTGTNSVVKETGAGDLYIAGENIRLTNGTFAQKYLMAYPNAQVELYHSGNLRVVTTAAGATLYGNLAVPAGNGIDFSATSGTGTSELFDDYEEGTWTPAVYFGGANVGMTVATTGHYTLVGRLVVVRCSVTFSAKGSSTGTFQIGGLPFVGSINGAGAMGFNYGWATMPTGGVSFIQSSGSIYAMAANNGAYMDDTYFNDVTAINDITIAYMV